MSGSSARSLSNPLSKIQNIMHCIQKRDVGVKGEPRNLDKDWKQKAHMNSSSYKHKCCLEDTKFWPKLYAMVYISSEPNHSRRKTGDPPNNPKDRRSEPAFNSHPNSTLSICKLSGVYKGNTFGELPILSSQFGKPNTYWCGFQPKIYGGVLPFRCQ